jgi:hypothetical protein
VKLDAGGNNIGIGICLAESIDKEEDANNGNLSFVFNCTTFCAYDDSGNKTLPLFQVPAGGLPAGSVIGLTLDLDKKTLSFTYNGVSKQAFEVPEDTWYPFFALGQAGKSVKVIHGAAAVAPVVEEKPAPVASPSGWNKPTGKRKVIFLFCRCCCPS